MAESRLYTIPGGVQKEAKKALEWRKEHKRGGTPVGLNTARTLAKGGQIGIEKVRHIAKYFPRHEVDKKGKGWAPGEDKFPSNGRIAWALWGGDAGQRWASAIVERENKKKATTAGGGAYGFVEQEQPDELNAFKMAHELDPYLGPEFMARVRLDNSGIDRLYKVEVDGQVYLWDGSGWDDMGHVDGDVYSYDKALDELGDTVEKTHVIIDPSSAVIISAFLQERPFQPVTLDEIDPEETALMSEGLQDEDFGMIDRVLTAAGESKPSGGINPNDGVDTPEERSARASQQPKDALGRFAKVGTEVVVGGDYERGQGKITSINNETGKAQVLLKNGSTIEVNTTDTSPINPAEARASVSGTPEPGLPLNLSGIIGEPRTPVDMPKAHLPGTLPVMDAKGLKDFMNNWASYVTNARNNYKPSNTADKKRVQDRYGKDVGAKFSITAAAEKALTPETSDVAAKYLAIVSPDDLSAVMDMVAIVPASATSTEPITYERVNKTWQRNDQILADLRSSTPPPVVELKDKEVIDDVLTQVDDVAIQASSYDFAIFWNSVVEPLLSAGGLDRNRGNAEKLRRYWVRGEGAAKIRWGQPGDWKRCVKYLSKHLGPRAKGYCQLRHKEALGYYTSTHAKKERANG